MAQYFKNRAIFPIICYIARFWHSYTSVCTTILTMSTRFILPVEQVTIIPICVSESIRRTIEPLKSTPHRFLPSHYILKFHAEYAPQSLFWIFEISLYHSLCLLNWLVDFYNGRILWKLPLHHLIDSSLSFSAMRCPCMYANKENVWPSPFSEDDFSHSRLVLSEGPVSLLCLNSPTWKSIIPRILYEHFSVACFLVSLMWDKDWFKQASSFWIMHGACTASIFASVYWNRLTIVWLFQIL